LVQGSTRAQERAAREKERQQLADLVGRNLTYVSQLDGLDFARSLSATPLCWHSVRIVPDRRLC
jgi:hypothetical protein